MSPQRRTSDAQRETALRALALGFTQAEAGAKAGVSERTVRNILSEPGARRELEDLREQLRTSDQKDAIRFLRETYSDTSVKMADRIRAAEALMRARVVPDNPDTPSGDQIVRGEIHVDFSKLPPPPTESPTVVHDDKREAFQETSPAT